jgi:Tol biopolymer transport system component
MKRLAQLAAVVSMLMLSFGSIASARAVVPGANGRIVFARALEPCTTGCNWELVTADPDGANETVLAGPFPRSVWDDHFIANWSPDGSTAVFMADLGGGQGIWQVDANGTGLHELFSAPAGSGFDDGPSFTPDGAHILFTRCCPEGYGYSLWSIKADGTGLKDVTIESVVNGDGPSDNLPQVSPDGKRILFHRCVPNDSGNCTSQVAIVNINGGNLRLLTPPRLNAQVANWSPDGKQIVFEIHPPDGTDNIAIMRADGSGLRQLTFDTGRMDASISPCFSPDGSKILFAHSLSTGWTDLFSMNPDGSGVTQVTGKGTGEFWPQWAAA